MLDVADDPDNLPRAALVYRVWVVTQQNLLPDRVFVRKEAMRKRFVHDNRPRRGLCIVIIKIAPLFQRNLEGAEKARNDFVVAGTRPLVVDPFAGGGSIPLEALRVGADTFASDLNPVAVLLNKVVLEYIPKYGQKLADEVRKWGQWIKEQAEKELAEFYPKDPDGATPIAPIDATGCESKTGVHVRPELIVFQRPPPTEPK